MIVHRSQTVLDLEIVIEFDVSWRQIHDVKRCVPTVDFLQSDNLARDVFARLCAIINSPPANRPYQRQRFRGGTEGDSDIFGLADFEARYHSQRQLNWLCSRKRLRAQNG